MIRIAGSLKRLKEKLSMKPLMARSGKSLVHVTNVVNVRLDHRMNTYDGLAALLGKQMLAMI